MWHSREITDRFVAGLAGEIREHMTRLSAIGLKSVVVGMSGGADSAVAAALAHVSETPVSAVVIEMDHPARLSENVRRAISQAERIGVPHQVVNAAEIYHQHLALCDSNSKIARVHLRSRVVNNVVFQFADNRSAAVLDTRDKSECILRIYEEAFRGHIAPLAGLYKSEVYELADYFGLRELRQLPSGCPELVDLDAFGAGWETLDPLLFLLTERKLTPAAIADRYGVDHAWLEELERRIRTQPLRTTTHEVDIACATR